MEAAKLSGLGNGIAHLTRSIPHALQRDIRRLTFVLWFPCESPFDFDGITRKRRDVSD